jgi:uncharacterized protein (TIGR03790 family)
MRILWILAAIAGLWPAVCLALSPRQILVVANAKCADSLRLARYYMEKRRIPVNNLVKLRVTDKESCSREDYDNRVARVVRQWLRERGPGNGIRCLATMYGVPLKVEPPRVSIKQMAESAVLHRREDELLRRLEDKDAKSREQSDAIKTELDGIRKKINALANKDQRSALDSELALVRVDGYPLSGWVQSPFFVGYKGRKLPYTDEQVFLVSRLDGPTPAVVRRIIDDSVAVENRGLSGTAYFDARWRLPDDSKMVTGYALYDKFLHLAADRIRKTGRMKQVVLDDSRDLFQKGACPDAALYCGWYSLANYVDAFQWVKGAVGYHIASSECGTLKKGDSQVWCKRMLEEGVAATVGPTSEPYVQAFPVPVIFFGLLVSGKLSLVECYALSTPFLSWQMVLIGDPLYRPFGNR